jgi:hypothetical protein
MDCRRFRSQHLSYLDDTLCGHQTAAMQQHLTECPGCAAHDQLIRRSLTLARSLEPVTLSADFPSRLYARLREAPAAMGRTDDDEAGDAEFLVPVRGWQPSRRALVAVAAGMVVMTTVAWQRAEPAREQARRLAAQAAQPEPHPALSYSPALVGAIMAGNPVLPAALAADELPITWLTTASVQPVGGMAFGAGLPLR